MSRSRAGRRTTARYIAISACALVLGLVVASSGMLAADEVTTVTPGDVDRGESVYGMYCATCHGELGDGTGPTAHRYPDFPPRDFTSGNYKFRSTVSGNLPLSEDLARTVRRGIPGTSMPAWAGVLGEQRIADVVAYIRTFSDLFDDFDEYPPEVVAIPESAPAASDDRLHRGRQIYLMQRCWPCPGVDGAASGPQAAELTDEDGQPVVPWDLTSGLFRGGDSPVDLYRTLATGLDGTPMPAYLHPFMLFRPTESAFDQLLTELIDYSGGDLDEQELDALRAFTQTLPTAAEASGYDEAAQAQQISDWHWDMTLYVDSLSRAGSFGRRLAGVDPVPPLFGAGSATQ